ncbi:hypothetical protein HK098_007923 [Nowakowskiella sp. JEL0407]|nr:hypothetical protein HK098_007923 [Nowakowskiella sp. JEL0407]
MSNKTEDWPGYVIGGMIAFTSVAVRVLIGRVIPTLSYVQSAAIGSVAVSLATLMLISSLDCWGVCGWKFNGLSKTLFALILTIPLMLHATFGNFTLFREFSLDINFQDPFSPQVAAIIAAVGVSFSFLTAFSSLLFVFGDFPEDSQFQKPVEKARQTALKVVVTPKLKPVKVDLPTLLIPSLLAGLYVFVATLKDVEIFDIIRQFGIGFGLSMAYGGIFAKTKLMWPQFLASCIYFLGIFLKEANSDGWEIGNDIGTVRDGLIQLAFAVALGGFGFLLTNSALKEKTS